MCAFLSPTQRRYTSRFLLLVLLFVQGILAAQACMGPRDLVRSVQHPNRASQQAMPCHDQADASPTVEMATNVCVAHCTAGDESSDTPQLSIPAAPTMPVLWLTVRPITQLSHRQWLLVPPAEAPPIAILFGAFRC